MERSASWLWLNRVYERFLKIRGDPREVSLGLALGLFFGMTPLFGLQIVAAVFLASLLKASKISAALGTWISNPLTMPLIYSSTYAIGSRLLGSRRPLLEAGESGFNMFLSMIHKTPGILWAMFVGGVLLGLPLAVAGYFISFSILRRHQEEIKQQLVRQKERLARRKKTLEAKTGQMTERLLNKRERRRKQKSLKKHKGKR